MNKHCFIVVPSHYLDSVSSNLGPGDYISSIYRVTLGDDFRSCTKYTKNIRGPGPVLSRVCGNDFCSEKRVLGCLFGIGIASTRVDAIGICFWGPDAIHIKGIMFLGQFYYALGVFSRFFTLKGYVFHI